MKLMDVFLAGAIAMLFTLLLFRLWGGILAAQETALYRIQAVNDATFLVNSFRDANLHATANDLDPAMLRGISGIVREERGDPNRLRYRELDFVLLGAPCRVRTGGVK